jgi:ribosomal protein L3 glutamine methyltransferase
MHEYVTATKSFNTLLDFFRFGVSQARAKAVYFGHGTDNAWDDIMALVLATVHLPYDADATILQAQVTDEERNELALQLAKRIQKRIPVPYLTHEAFFCGLSFYVDERVLIPRSPMAELITRQFQPWLMEEQVQHVLDLCTGSACIAIACCYAFPEAQVDAVDLSRDALAVAEINRERHQVQAQLQLIESDCFQAVAKSKRYDVIISNPPYVGQDEMQTLPVEYQHEPRMALEAAANGLAIVETILFSAADFLTDHGILVLEVGNSDALLIERYSEVPFTWLDFEHGGCGVLLLTAEQVKLYFNSSK